MKNALTATDKIQKLQKFENEISTKKVIDTVMAEINAFKRRLSNEKKVLEFQSGRPSEFS